MERSSLADWRATRAARSLYINRRNRDIVEQRIERATATVASFLALHGLALARLGRYEVETLGDDLRVSQLPASGARQLVLPDTDPGSPSDGLETLVALAAGDDGLDDELLETLQELRVAVSLYGEGGDVD